MTIKRKCLAVIKEFTKQQEERIINSANLGMLYSHVNKKLASRSGIGVLKDPSGSFVHCRGVTNNDSVGGVFRTIKYNAYA